MRADLHLHTTASDGVLPPLAAAAYAAAQGVELLAVTDHDALAGADDLRGEAALPLRVLPGTELSLRDMKGLHLLVLGVPEAPSPLREKLADLAKARVARARSMVERLHALGVPVEAEALLEREGTVGRAHLARLLVAQGYCGTVAEAFAKYLAEGRPAYVAGERLCMAEAIPLAHGCGAAAVLAHPALLPVEPLMRLPLMEKWAGLGLDGVEVYHPAMLGEGFTQTERQVRRMGLLVTGGSDFHQMGESTHGQPGAMMALWPQMDEDTAALLDRVGRERLI